MPWKIILIFCVFSFASCEKKDEGFKGASREELSDSYAYKISEFSDTIERCAPAQSSSQACKFEALPLIGMDTDTPTVNEIMTRVLVSHDWMGERFEEVLNIMPLEMRLLFRSVTMIIIDDDIRPAYFTANTAAIYLDPQFLWLSVGEAQTINPKEDFRTGFSNDLNFRAIDRYVLNHSIPFSWSSLTEPQARSLNDIEYLIANLLLHELAHANDFFPPELHNQINLESKPWPAASAMRNDWISTRLHNSNPISSEPMHALARVMFHGDSASNAQQNMSAADVAGEFRPDSASDDYSYSSAHEDVAMLFEETMMNYLFGIERDIAFTTAPTPANLCTDYQIAWGVRTRIGTSQVSARAEFVANEVLPNINFNDFFSNLASTRELPTDVDWCQSRNFERPLDTSNNKAQAELINSTEVWPEQPYYH